MLHNAVKRYVGIIQLRSGLTIIGFVYGSNARNGNRFLIDRQLAVGRPGNHVVAGGILRFIHGDARERHIIIARIRAATAGRHAVEGQSIDAGREAGDGLFRPVVGNGFCVAVRRQGHFSGVDRQRAVHDDKGHIIVDIGIRKIINGQLHAVAARVRAAHAVVAIEGEVTFGILRVADRDIVTADRVRLTVVGRFDAVPGNRHCHSNPQCGFNIDNNRTFAIIQRQSQGNGIKRVCWHNRPIPIRDATICTLRHL